MVETESGRSLEDYETLRTSVMSAQPGVTKSAETVAHFDQVGVYAEPDSGALEISWVNRKYYAFENRTKKEVRIQVKSE